MALADTNIWLALALSEHALHAVVRSWFARQTSSDHVLFCRLTQQSFLRLLTTESVLAPYGIPPLTNTVAWSIYEEFRADERVSWMEEPRNFELHWKRLSSGNKSSPKLWMDAYLAALAIAGKNRLVTTDKGFGQFNGLDLILLTSE